MSPKELLYIEDALNHEDNMEKCASSHASQLKDPDLKAFAEQIAARHKQNYSKIYSLLE